MMLIKCGATNEANSFAGQNDVLILLYYMLSQAIKAISNGLNPTAEVKTV
jgi:hypothetical protein